MWLRILGALLVALSGFLATLWRILRQILHETAGALFLLFAALGGLSAWREWRLGSTEWIVGVSLAFAAMMAAFAFASFRSARRLERKENRN